MQALFFDLPKMPELGNDDDMSCVQSDTGSIFLKPLKILQARQQINKTHAFLQKKKKNKTQNNPYSSRLKKTTLTKTTQLKPHLITYITISIT